MKLKILIKYHNGSKKIEQNGDWIDLFPRKEYKFNPPRWFKGKDFNEVCFDSQLVDLGISMKLPKYFEALINPRSSTYVKQGLIQTNSQGIIDNTYSGEEDIWKFPAIAIRETTIGPDKAICQFRIQPSMQAPWYIKLKWLFCNGIEFKEVDILNGPNRGGFGSTDK